MDVRCRSVRYARLSRIFGSEADDTYPLSHMVWVSEPVWSSYLVTDVVDVSNGFSVAYFTECHAVAINVQA